MVPNSNLRFHLVLAHGIQDDLPTRNEARSFWSGRFPQAVVTDFAFIESGFTRTWGRRGFVERAESLLRAVLRDRDHFFSQLPGFHGEHPPCVFIGHGLGASLVRQALVLGCQNPRYRYLVSNIAILILYAEPKAGTSSWEHEVFRILSGADVESLSPLELLQDLPTALQELHCGFEPEILDQYKCVIISGQIENIQVKAIVSRPMSPGKLNHLHMVTSNVDLWTFRPGEAITEQVFDIISDTIEDEAIFQSLKRRQFIYSLTVMESRNRYAHFFEPFPELTHWISEHKSYCDWRKSDLGAPYVLSFTGQSGLSTALLTSHFITILQNIAENAIVIKYSFSGDHQYARRSQLDSFYASMIRQILCSRPRLFLNVASVWAHILDEGMLNLNVLENILLSLLRRCTSGPVFCVVHGITEENFAVLEPALGLLNQDRLSIVCKLALLGDAPQLAASSHAIKIHRHINLTRENWQETAVHVYVQSKAAELSRKRPEWESCKDDVMMRLAAASTTFLQATLGMQILETADLPSTRGATSEYLKQLPSSLDELYTIGVQHTRRQRSLRVLLSMQWVFHAVRPLTLHELAVATALSSPELPSIHHLRDNLPLNIIEDIRGLEGILVYVIGMDVHPIHEAMSFAFASEQDLEDHDPHGTIVQRLLGYLEMVLKHTHAFEAHESSANRPQTDSSPVGLVGIEFELVAYAVTNLAEHYKHARNASMFKDRLLDIFEHDGFSAVWLRAGQALFECFKTDGKSTELGNSMKIASLYGLADVTKLAIGRATSLGIFDQIKHSEDLSDALQLAVSYGHLKVITLLLEEDAQPAGAMLLAAKLGSLDTLKVLLHRNQSLINEEDESGQTALDLAVMNGHSEVATYLHAQAANKGIVLSLNSNKPLVIAAATGQTRVLQFLIDADSYTSRLNEAKTSMLHAAAAGGFDEIVQLLLEDSEVDVNLKNQAGFTAYHLAACSGNNSTCDLLAVRGDVNILTEDGLSALHLAAQCGQLCTVKNLLEHFVNLMHEDQEPENAFGGDQVQDVTFEEERLHDPWIFDMSHDTWSPLHLAAFNGHLDVVQELLKHERYSSQRGRAIALLQASMRGYTEIVKELLQSGITTAMMDATGNTALHLSTQRQSSDILKLLLDVKTKSGQKLFDVNAANSGGETPLHLAATCGRLLIVQILLQQDPQPKLSALTGTGRTALHCAAAYGHTLVANELLQHLSCGETSDLPDVSLVPDKDGSTALILALVSGQAEIARALLRRTKEETGSSQGSRMTFAAHELAGKKDALLAAIQGNSEGCVKLVLENGLASTTSSEPRTMGIHVAALTGSVPMITLLHDHGADMKVEDEDGETPLHLACRSSSSEAVRLLLNLGADIDALDSSGATPLFRAAYQGRNETVAVLLSWSPSPDLNIQRSHKTPGWTALHAAYDNPEITRMLLEAGADTSIEQEDGDPAFFFSADCYSNTVQQYLNATNKVDPDARNSKDGTTALHIAAEGARGEDDTVYSLENALEVCRLLLSQGADINATTHEGVAPIHLAAYSGNLEMVQCLVKQHNINLEVDCEEFGTPLMTAARYGESDIARVLLEAGARVDATSNKFEYHTALQAAASKGFEDVLRLIVEQKDVDVNATGGTFGSALCAAVTAGNMACIEMLLDKGADISCDVGEQGTALELAITGNNWPLVDKFLDGDYGAINLNKISHSKYGTALVAAIESGKLEYVKQLLALQAHPEVYAEDQDAPVHVAVRKGGLDMVKTLVEFGAQTSYIDKRGGSLLSCAVRWTSIELVPYLLQRPDIDIAQQDLHGRTALICAVIEGNGAVEVLLKHEGNDIDRQDNLGNTALMHALTHGYEPHIRLLLDAGADLHVKDIRGRDALYWAALQPNFDIFKVIVDAAVKQDIAQSCFQLALNAAAVTDSGRFVELLLDNVTKYDTGLADQDDWRPEYSVVRYRCSPETSILIEKATGRTQLQSHQNALAPRKPPSGWHPQDHGLDVILEHDPRRVGVEGIVVKGNASVHPSIARADHPMVPGADGIYYFEVTIIKGGDKRRSIGVGFCEASALDLSQMVGWGSETWGYHSDDGKTFEGPTWSGDPFGPQYAEGDVIGCGVDFTDETAFYTKNGRIIGQAFKNVRGRLYPALSFDRISPGCMVSVEFWDDKQNGNEKFRFKGPYNDPATKEMSQAARGAAETEDAHKGSEAPSLTPTKLKQQGSPKI